MGSPNGPAKNATHSRPNSTRAKVDGQGYRPLVFLGTPPLADADKALVTGNSSGTVRSKRSNVGAAAKTGTIVTRSSRRSTRGPNSDAAASGVDEPKDDGSIPATDGDNGGHGDTLFVSKPIQPPVTPPVLVYSNPGPYWQS